jgi:DNA-binding NarL/FixJ family response regulator
MESVAQPAPRPPRCLIVDQYDVITDAIAEILEHYGGVVVVGRARTGSEGLDVLEAEAPRLAIVADVLPDMTGLDFAARVRRVEQDVALILLAGSVRRAHPDEALAAGFRAVARKAVPPTELVAAIRAVLEGEGDTPSPSRGTSG